MSRKKALKQVNGLQETDYLTRVKELGPTTLGERKHTPIFKIIHWIDDVDRKIWFELYGDTKRRVTRTSEQSLCIVAFRPNLGIRKHFFSNRIVQQWNALPESIKNARNVKQFKNMYLSQVPLPWWNNLSNLCSRKWYGSPVKLTLLPWIKIIP